jgi:hypothetical protein
MRETISEFIFNVSFVSSKCGSSLRIPQLVQLKTSMHKGISVIQIPWQQVAVPVFSGAANAVVLENSNFEIDETEYRKGLSK